MKKKKLTILVLIFGLGLFAGIVSGQIPLGTAFTYQGWLMDKKNPADGQYDFIFEVYNDPNLGAQLGTIDIEDHNVMDGYFSVELDFGSGIFTGDRRWLETSVRLGSSTDPCDFVTLRPRHELTLAPYSIYSVTAGAVPDGITGIGTQDYIPRFSDSNTLNDSVIYESAGNIGIGINPGTRKLKVEGDVEATEFYGDGSGLTNLPVAGIPSRVIVMWSGLIGDIPEGWALCDGNNETPNLTSRFIKSVPNASTEPGSTGGSSTHSHSAGSYNAASHTHSYSWEVYQDINTAGGTGDPKWNNVAAHTHTYSGTTDPGGGGTITGSSDAASSLPPYYELAFIMKL